MKMVFEIMVLASVLTIACAWLVRWAKYRGSKEFANANNVPGAGTRQSGQRTYLCGLLADWTVFAAAYPGWSNAQDGTAPAGRWALVKQGADETHIRMSAGATDKVIGICTDVPDAVEDPLNVSLFGATPGTMFCIAAAAITIGDLLQSNGDGAAKTAVGTGYAFGKALQAAAGAGDLIEFQPLGISDRALT
jgi:hypothetical protein